MNEGGTPMPVVDLDAGRDRGPLGVSSFLPAPAAEALVRAHATALGYADGSLARLRAIDDGIKKVKRQFPAWFREDGDGLCR